MARASATTSRRLRYRGVIYGLAIGDALGAPVEFLSLEEIRARHGAEGVATFMPWGGFPAGSYTDDTQMSLATAKGTLAAFEAGALGSIEEAAPHVWRSYLDWRGSQSRGSERRGPGATCMSALAGGVMGTAERPLNDRKGCGTIMRIAPCALARPGEDSFAWAAACGAMTHGHPSGYLAGAAFALALEGVVEGRGLRPAIESALSRALAADGGGDVARTMRRALDADDGGSPIALRLARMGGGWVADEALGIALTCVLAFPNDFAAAVRCAVNITGDSDSTGSVTGALAGGLLGEEAIPSEWVAGVEDAGFLREIADRLYDAAETLDGVRGRVRGVES